jgi:hypothetical protein
MIERRAGILVTSFLKKRSSKPGYDEVITALGNK